MSKPLPDDWISGYLDGELTSVEQQRVEQALGESADLQRMCDELRVLRSTLQAMPNSEPSCDLSREVLNEIQRRQSPADTDRSKKQGGASGPGVGDRERRAWNRGLALVGTLAGLAALVFGALWMPTFDASPDATVADTGSEADVRVAHTAKAQRDWTEEMPNDEMARGELLGDRPTRQLEELSLEKDSPKRARFARAAPAGSKADDREITRSSDRDSHFGMRESRSAPDFAQPTKPAASPSEIAAGKGMVTDETAMPAIEGLGSDGRRLGQGRLGQGGLGGGGFGGGEKMGPSGGAAGMESAPDAGRGMGFRAEGARSKETPSKGMPSNRLPNTRGGYSSPEPFQKVRSGEFAAYLTNLQETGVLLVRVASSDSPERESLVELHSQVADAGRANRLVEWHADAYPYREKPDRAGQQIAGTRALDSVALSSTATRPGLSFLRNSQDVILVEGTADQIRLTLTDLVNRPNVELSMTASPPDAWVDAVRGYGDDPDMPGDAMETNDGAEHDQAIAPPAADAGTGVESAAHKGQLATQRFDKMSDPGSRPGSGDDGKKDDVKNDDVKNEDKKGAPASPVSRSRASMKKDPIAKESAKKTRGVQAPLKQGFAEQAPPKSGLAQQGMAGESFGSAAPSRLPKETDQAKSRSTQPETVEQKTQDESRRQPGTDMSVPRNSLRGPTEKSLRALGRQQRSEPRPSVIVLFRLRQDVRQDDRPIAPKPKK